MTSIGIIGIIGIGAMGRAMAENLLQRDVELAVYNRTPSRLADLKERGVVVERSSAGVVQHANCTLMCVADDAAVRDVIFGPAMTADVLRDKHIVDLSSISVSLARECYARCKSLGGSYLDAPVSGGVEGAREGTLSIMVGGDKAAFDRVQPVLAWLGNNVTWLGAAGNGALAKQINQIVVASYLAGLGEAFALAERLGMDLQTLRSAIGGGYAQSRVLDAKFPNYVADRYEPGGRASLHKKDLNNALAVAEEHGLRPPLTKVLRDLFVEAEALGYGHLDHSVLYRVLHEKMQDQGGN
jgi:2-hydroxy-3-oxopropionate reductase